MPGAAVLFSEGVWARLSLVCVCAGGTDLSSPSSLVALGRAQPTWNLSVLLWGRASSRENELPWTSCSQKGPV